MRPSLVGEKKSKRGGKPPQRHIGAAAASRRKMYPAGLRSGRITCCGAGGQLRASRAVSSVPSSPKGVLDSSFEELLRRSFSAVHSLNSATKEIFKVSNDFDELIFEQLQDMCRTSAENRSQKKQAALWY